MSRPAARRSSPFIIGVSGHRNVHPSAIAAMRQEIRAFFELLRSRMPHTELRLMTGMAQGADLIAADVALESGVRVEALLPRPFDQYVAEFDSASAELLRRLLAHPSLFCSALDKGEAGEPNDAAYVRLSEALAARSSVLLALWNGEISPHAGGTSDTALCYLDAQPVHSARDAAIAFVAAGAARGAHGPRFVYWIYTLRGDAAAVDTRAPRYVSSAGEGLLVVDERLPDDLALQWRELDHYNENFNEWLAANRGDALEFLTPPETDAFDAERLQTLGEIDAEFARANALALHYQKLSIRVFRWFGYLAVVLALLFLSYAKLAASNLLLTSYLVILAGGLLLHAWVRRRHWFSRHLVYRVLAETMRTKFFLHAALADRMIDAEGLMQLTGIGRFSGFGWMALVIRSIRPLRSSEAGRADTNQAQLEWLRQHWIAGQERYFEARVHTLARMHRRLALLKNLLLGVTAAMIVVLVVFADFLKSHGFGAVSFKDALIFLLGLLPVWLGIWELYQNKMATRELLWQYRNQLRHFSNAAQQLERSPSWPRRQAILAEVGAESLMESYLWTMHRFHREHEPPAAA